MADKTKKSLLPDPTGKVVMLSASTYSKLKALVDLLDASFDPRDFVTKMTSGGKQVRLRGIEEFLETIKAEVGSCKLGKLTKNAGDAFYTVEPGYVHGGGPSVLLSKVNIAPAIGSHLYIEMSWTGTAIDDVLQAGGTRGATSLKVGALPTDDVLTATSLTGKHYRTLGEWVDDGAGNAKFIADGCGSYSVRFCPSGWSGLRGGI